MKCYLRALHLHQMGRKKVIFCHYAVFDFLGTKQKTLAGTSETKMSGPGLTLIKHV